MLYHLPPLTRTAVATETAAWAVQQPDIIGIKDSSGDLSVFEAFRDVAGQRPDWGVYVGADTLLVEAVKRGAHGGVSGGANLAPDLFVNLFHAAFDRDEEKTKALQSRVEALVGTLFAPEPHPIEVIKVIKTSLAALGLCGDVMAEPFQPLSVQKREAVRQKLEGLAAFVRQ